MALRRSLSTLVVAALLFAQTLGLLHGVIHAPHLRQGEPAAAADHARAQKSRLPADAFAHEAGDTTCRLLDALACGSGAAAAPSGTVVACPASAEPLFAPPTPRHAAQCAQFEARGPPALS